MFKKKPEVTNRRFLASFQRTWINAGSPPNLYKDVFDDEDSETAPDTETNVFDEDNKENQTMVNGKAYTQTPLATSQNYYDVIDKLDQLSLNSSDSDETREETLQRLQMLQARLTLAEKLRADKWRQSEKIKALEEQFSSPEELINQVLNTKHVSA